MERTEHRRAKLLTAVMAASVLTGMGAFALASNQESMTTDSAGPMSVGQTTTSTPAPATMSVPMAKPPVKAPRPKGF
jgi:hypothetical protein